MGLYLGSKQTMFNKFGSKPIREVYLGSKGVMYFDEADYSTDEIVAEDQSSSYPIKVTATGSKITIGTNSYVSGYGYSKYYCDHLKIELTYSGICILFDTTGNIIVRIEGSQSWASSSNKYTITASCVVNNVTLINTSVTSSSSATELRTYEVYYDTSTKKWKVIWNGTTYSSETTDWTPTYFRVFPQSWVLGSVSGDGFVTITYMNKAKGYPVARE